MSYAAVAAAVIGIGTTALGAATGGQQKTGETTNKLEFPEETRRLFQDVEKPLLEDNLKEQTGLLSPFLGGFKSSAFAQNEYGGVGGVTKAATRKAAGQSGVDDLGAAFENIEGLTPELLESLRALVLNRGSQINAVVPAGYGQFLSPSTFSQTQGAGANPYQTGFALAQTGAQLVGALGRAGAFG